MVPWPLVTLAFLVKNSLAYYYFLIGPGIIGKDFPGNPVIKGFTAWKLFILNLLAKVAFT